MRTLLDWMLDTTEKNGVEVEGYPIECDFCGEESVQGHLVHNAEGFVEVWETCETCSVRTHMGPVQ